MSWPLTISDPANAVTTSHVRWVSWGEEDTALAEKTPTFIPQKPDAQGMHQGAEKPSDAVEERAGDAQYRNNVLTPVAANRAITDSVAPNADAQQKPLEHNAGITCGGKTSARWT